MLGRDGREPRADDLGVDHSRVEQRRDEVAVLLPESAQFRDAEVSLSRHQPVNCGCPEGGRCWSSGA